MREPVLRSCISYGSVAKGVNLQFDFVLGDRYSGRVMVLADCKLTLFSQQSMASLADGICFEKHLSPFCMHKLTNENHALALEVKDLGGGGFHCQDFEPIRSYRCYLC